MDYETFTLYSWQKEALIEVEKYNHNCTVLSGTGTGKSIFGLLCALQKREKTIIIVPTENLMWQWRDEVLNFLKVDKEKVGVYYGKLKENKPITIAIINSIRNFDLRCFKYVILDEAHKIVSDENIKPILNGGFSYLLCLTATLYREDLKHNKLVKIAPICYEYEQKNAIQDNVLNEFDLINYGINLTQEEYERYIFLESVIKDSFVYFSYDFKQLVSFLNQKEFKNPLYKIAVELMANINERRTLYTKSENKIVVVENLVEQHKNDKIIIFNEYIDIAETIFEKLKLNNNIKVGIYHSKNKKQEIINQFSNNEINVLVTVKSLNEGLNIKNCNIGIEVARNSVRRNSIQKIGRIIRKVENKNAYFYQLYCVNTKEYFDIIKKSRYFKDTAKQIKWINSKV